MTMHKHSVSKQEFPQRFFAAAFLISLLAIIFGAWQSWRLHEHFEEMARKHVAITQAVGRIMLLDEVLTMSARMASATGDFSYEKRYDQYDPVLTKEIETLRTMLAQEDMEQFAGETDEANLALVKMGRQAFALAHQSRGQEATALLASDEYSRLKNIYAGGMRKTVEAADALIESDNRQSHILSLKVIAASALSALVLLLAWLLAVRSAKMWVEERKRAEEALAQSQALYHDLVETSQDLIWQCDVEGRYTYLNPAWENVFGYKIEEMLGKKFTDFQSPEMAARDQKEFARLLQGNSVKGLETTHIGKSGKEIALIFNAKFLLNEDGKIVGTRGTAYDITERKQAEQALRNSAEKLRLFAENVPAMAAWYDENLRCRFANKAFAEFLDFTVENLLGKHLREVAGEEAYREIEGHFVQVLQGHPVTYERTRKLQNGESRCLEIKLVPHIGERGQVLGCFTVMTDITEHKLAEERIQRVAHHDSLTGLPNRLLFNDRLNQAISLAKRDSRQFALLYLDLDKFKAVNDTLGHAAGDELLKSAAEIIRRQVRESDTVARVGGDEFAVILPDITRHEEVETVANKIIAALATPFQLGSQGQSVDIGSSIGIALYPTDGRDSDALVKAADAAMYSAKQVGSSFRFCGA